MYSIESWHFVFIWRGMARLCLKKSTQQGCTVTLLKLFIANPPELLYCSDETRIWSPTSLCQHRPRDCGTRQHRSHLLPSESEPQGIGKSNSRLSLLINIFSLESSAAWRSVVSDICCPTRTLHHGARRRTGPSPEWQFPRLLWWTFSTLRTFSLNESRIAPDDCHKPWRMSECTDVYTQQNESGYWADSLWEMFKGKLRRNGAR